MSLADASFETTRLVVRSCQLDDAKALSALMTPSISTWVAAWPAPLTIKAAATILSDNIAQAEQGNALAAVVIEKASSDIIGWLKIEISSAESGCAELGYWVGEKHQRKGYAEEMARGALDFGFGNLGLHSIRAGAQVGNDGSLRLLEKLGMTELGVESVWAPARQRYEDCIFWELKRP